MNIKIDNILNRIETEIKIENEIEHKTKKPIVTRCCDYGDYVDGY